MVSTQKKLRVKLRAVLSAANTIYQAVKLTTHFERELDRLLASLPGRPELRLKLIIDHEQADPSRLSLAEAAGYDSVRNTARAFSWLQGRHVLKQLLRRCGLADDTSHLQFPNRNFSLTHSGPLAAGVFATVVCGDRPPSDATDEFELVGTGIDFESPHPVNPRATRFFLHPDEAAALTQLCSTAERPCALAPDPAGAEIYNGQQQTPPPHRIQIGSKAEHRPFDETSINQTSTQSLNDHLLRLWTAKEALFKADPANGSSFPGQYILDNPLAKTGWARHRAAPELRFAYSSVSTDFGTITLALALRRSVR